MPIGERLLFVFLVCVVAVITMCVTSTTGTFMHGVELATFLSGEGQIVDATTHQPIYTGMHRAGEKMTLSAVPAAGWTSRQWHGSVINNTNPLSLTLDFPKGLIAEFVQRPGGDTLDLVSDLAYTLSAWGINSTVDTFDRNEVRHQGSVRVFVGNGVPDAVELYLLQSVLKRLALDLSARGGVVHDFVRKAWATNLARAETDLPNVDARIRRTVAGYMTFGDYWTALSIKDMIETAYPGVTFNIYNYDVSRQKLLSYKHDANNDGVSNADEWNMASPDGSLDHFPAFADAVLDPNPPLGKSLPLNRNTAK